MTRCIQKLLKLPARACLIKTDPKALTAESLRMKPERQVDK